LKSKDFKGFLLYNI